MFGLIRIAISGIVFVVLYVPFRKKIAPTKLKKMSVILFAVVCIFGSMLLCLIPFENLFVNFDSAEASYDYFYMDNDGELLQIEGKNSTFVQKSQDITNTIVIVPKTEKGWKVPVGIYTKLVYNQVFEDFVVYVYQFRDTSDYYVCITANNKMVHTLTDENGTVFVERQRQVASYISLNVEYYAYVPDFKENYTLIVNDEAVCLSEGNGIGIAVNRLN